MSQHSKPLASPDTAILVADWGEDYALSGIFGFGHDLVPILDKPMLQRAVEQLVLLGCSKIEVVLGDYASEHREFLGQGQRWGVQIRYHYRHAGEPLSTQFRSWIDSSTSTLCWLADGRCLPQRSALQDCGSFMVGNAGCIVVDPHAEEPVWSGWGLFSSSWLGSKQIPATRQALSNLLLKSEWIEKRVSEHLLAANEPASFLSCNLHILSAEDSAGPSVGRGCNISPQARILPPVHLGQHVRIGPNTTVGPNVVIGDNCVIDQDVTIESCVVLPATYVGMGVELKNSVVGGNTVANISLDTVVSIDNKSILCALSAKGASSLGDRWAALVLRLALAPVHWAAQRRCKSDPQPVQHGYQISRALGPRPWAHHFCYSFYPSLREVESGRLHLAGPIPRSLAEQQRLPAQWRQLYETTDGGLLSDALLRNPDELGPDELFASDAMALAGQHQASTKLALLLGYLGAVLRDLLGSGNLTDRNTTSDPTSKRA